MSYAAILEKLDQTSIDMELKRTQFHDAKIALKDAEKSLTTIQKEKIEHKELLSYLDLEKSKKEFESERYELSRQIALQSLKDSNNTLGEIKKLKLDRDRLEEILDDALIEKLQFNKKEKDDVKSSVKDIDQFIGTAKILDAQQRIEDEREKLETKIARKRILKFAPPSWNELEKLDKTTELYEYYINEKWDLDGIKDDLKILKQRKNEKEDIGIELTGIPDVWRELNTLDKQAKESDYRVGNSWDISGIRDDLALLKNRNQKLTIFEDKKQKKKVFTKTIEKKEKEVKIFKKAKKSEHNSAHPETDSKNTKLDDLKYLKELYDEGLIDSEEFKTMKNEVLGK